MKKAKHGPRPSADPRVTVSIVLSEETLDMMNHMADCAGVSRSQILRGMIKKEFHRFHGGCNGTKTS